MNAKASTTIFTKPAQQEHCFTLSFLSASCVYLLPLVPSENCYCPFPGFQMSTCSSSCSCMSFLLWHMIFHPEHLTSGNKSWGRCSGCVWSGEGGGTQPADGYTEGREEGMKRCLQPSYPFSALLQALPSIQMAWRPDKLFILDFTVAGWHVQFLCSLSKSDLNVLFIV